MNLKTLLILPTSAFLLLSGCVESDTDEGGSTSGNNPINAPTDYMRALSGAQRSAESTVGQASINQAIQQFQVVEERFPQNLNELVSRGYLPALPPAPRGSTYQYDPRTGALTVVQE